MGDTRVMDPDLRLEEQVCFALYAASRASTSAYRHALASVGLTYPQYLALLVLWEEDGALTVQDADARLSEQVWRLARELGVGLRELTPARNSLEQIFLSAVREERGADS